jgi:hypothetical protein
MRRDGQGRGAELPGEVVPGAFRIVFRRESPSQAEEEVNREEAINKCMDDIADLLLQSMYCEKTGGERSQWNRMMYQKVRARIAVFYDLIRPPVQPEAKPNGTPAQQQGAKK